MKGSRFFPALTAALLFAASPLSRAQDEGQAPQQEAPPQPQIKTEANPEATRYEAGVEPYVKERLTATELVEFVEAVQGYVYGKPPTPETMKVFDLDKNKTIILKYIGLHADQACHINLGNGFVAVCGDMEAEDGDKYVLYFICRRKSEKEERVARDGGYTYEASPLDSVTVRDVVIKSVNGVDRAVVTLGEDGMWRAEPVVAPSS